MICDVDMDLGYENNMFRMLGGNVDDYVFLGYFRGFDPSIDSYCVCLENFPKKVMLPTFFNPSYDFSKAFDDVKGILIAFGVILFVASCLVFSKLSSQKFDRLLCLLTTSNLTGRVLNLGWSG